MLRWVEEHVPGAELQQKSPGNISFSVAQQAWQALRVTSARIVNMPCLVSEVS